MCIGGYSHAVFELYALVGLINSSIENERNRRSIIYLCDIISG